MSSSVRENIEAIYPLSPLQKGMLFHSLAYPESGSYVLQDTLCIIGKIDLSAFWKSWKKLVSRHFTFRTLFIRLDGDVPLQVVLKSVDLPQRELDWTTLSDKEKVAMLSSLEQEEWSKGFNFKKAPLMRLVLIKIDKDSYRLIWTQHHALTDGWSGMLIWNEWQQIYDSEANDKELKLEERPQFRKYIQWLQRQDQAVSLNFWKKYLHGYNFVIAPPLAENLKPEMISDNRERFFEFSYDTSLELNELARTNNVTLNTIFQAAWAYLLFLHSGCNDVVFGNTVSGRPADLFKVGEIVGPFINSIPVRVSVDSKKIVKTLLKEIFDGQKKRQNYEHASLIDIRSCSSISSDRSLFETLVVFDNYPREENSGKESYKKKSMYN